MVQRVQCRHGAVRSEKNSCETMATNIFTSGGEASFPASRECGLRRAELHKEADGRASGRQGQAEERAEYIVTLMRLSGSS